MSLAYALIERYFVQQTPEFESRCRLHSTISGHSNKGATSTRINLRLTVE
tara:strand:+ start:812 stop:961 length:150 start_codon:yes stop_codon:yes gene_type:complete